MPYKDSEIAARQSKARMQKMRGKGVTKEGVTGQGVTTEGILSISQYHPILKDLIDPVKREKLERVCQALGTRRTEVYYGLRNPIPFNVVSELLEVTG